jgi:GTPase SAR1 family protein
MPAAQQQEGAEVLLWYMIRRLNFLERLNWPLLVCWDVQRIPELHSMRTAKQYVSRGLIRCIAHITCRVFYYAFPL